MTDGVVAVGPQIDKRKLADVLAVTTHYGLEDRTVARLLLLDNKRDTPEYRRWLDEATVEDLTNYVLWLMGWLVNRSGVRRRPALSQN